MAYREKMGGTHVGPKQNAALLDRPLYGVGKPDIGVAAENVGKLLPLEPHKRGALDAKYAQRVNSSPPGKNRGVLVVDFTGVDDPDIRELHRRGDQAARDQAAYMGQVMGDPNGFGVYTYADLREALRQGKRVAIVPYVNNPPYHQELEENELFDGNMRGRLEVHGIHPEVVKVLINKASLHEKLKKIGNPDLSVPHHEITTVSDIARASSAMLAFEEEMYAQTGINDYRKGVVVRLEDADGGFGSGRVVQDEDGNIKFINDENEKNPLVFGRDWTRAFDELQKYLYDVSNKRSNARVVVSRFLELESSPGNAMYFMEGDIFSFGPNGQHLDKQSGRCVGTYTLGGVRPAYEQRLVNAVKQVVYTVAEEQRVDPKELRGPLSIDLMIHGGKEIALQKAIQTGRDQRTLSSTLLEKLEHYGQPDHVLEWSVAECNARSTNYIGAIFNVMLVLGLPNTLRSINTVIAGGVDARDEVSLPKGVTIEDLREELLNQFTVEHREDGLIILRNFPIDKSRPDKVALIFTGDSARHLPEVFERARRRGTRE